MFVKKSWKPKLLFHIIPSNNGYRKPTSMKDAISCGLNVALSAIPPETIAGIAAANVNKKKNLTSSYALFSESTLAAS